MMQQRFTHKPKGRHPSMLFLCLLATMSLIGLSACQPKETNLPFETIEQRDTSGTGKVYESKQPGLIVIAVSEETPNLDALVTSKAQARLQSLDYNPHFVIVIFQGWKPTTRYSIQIERVTRRENTVTIYALFREPKPDEPKGDEVTSPYHLVQVQKVGTWGQQITFNLVVGDATVTSLVHRIP